MAILSTPDLIDQFPECRVLTDFVHFGGVSSFFGPILTVECFEDNSLIKQELSKPGNGEILVVSGNKSNRVALLGDNIALMAQKNGWKGIVIDGYVRDVEILNGVRIGVMAIGSCPRKSKKENKGIIGNPIKINEVLISTNEWLYADQNGIIISNTELKF